MFWEVDKDTNADSMSSRVFKKCIVVSQLRFGTCVVSSGFYLKMICEFIWLSSGQCTLWSWAGSCPVNLGGKNSNFIYPKEIQCGSRLEKEIFPMRTLEQVAQDSYKSRGFWRPDWTNPQTTWCDLRDNLALSTR